MPRPRRTPEEIARMRQRMLDAALSLLREGGPQAVSIRALAERVGMSHMVFYGYFRSRAELLHALADRQREWLRQRRAQLLEQAQSGDVAAIVRESLADYARMAQWSPRVYELVWVHQVEPAQEGLAEPNKMFALHVAHLQTLVELGMSRGVLARRDPFVAAAIAFTIVNGPLILFYSGRLANEAMRDQLVNEALSAAMAYLRGEPTQDEAPHPIVE